MANIAGIGITAVTNCGPSDNGENVFVTCKLINGDEHAIILSYQALGHFIAILQKVGNMAYERRIAHNPIEAEEGIVSSVAPIKELNVMTSREHSGVIFQMLTTDNIPIAVELPQDVAAALSDGLPEALKNIESSAPPKSGIKCFH